MASMVAKACSSTSTQMPVITAQEKGSRNKRKYRADPPLANPDKIIPLPETDCSSFEIPADQFESLTKNGCDTYCISHENNPEVIKLNLGLPPETSKVSPSQELETSSGEFHDADWSDRTESQLQELLLSNLDSIFRSAIKKIVCSGYSEEAANRAVLRNSLWYGCKDMASNIVENALTVLNSPRDTDPQRENSFRDLREMEKYVLAELVCLLREVRPFFSTGDAMWCLLICDMNVSHACAVDSDSLGSFFCSDASNGNSNVSGQHMPPCPPNASLVTYARRSETSNVTPFLTKHEFKAEDHKASSVFGGLTQENEGHSLANRVVDIKPFNATGLSHTTAQEKLAGSSRKTIGITKRDYILRQKSLHFEKYHHHRAMHGVKGTSRSGKLSSFGGLIMDKKLKGLSDSTGPNSKNPPPFDVPQENMTGNGVSPEPTANQESSLALTPVNAVPPPRVTHTELSLSFPSKVFANHMPIASIVPSREESRETTRAPQNRRDELIAKLVPRVRELQSQLQEWTEWANEKVMQAARRLSKEKEELKALRLEREEGERLKKEQQTSKESHSKKLMEIENALRKAGGQVQRANAAVRRREMENASLRRELEAAILHADESAMGCDKSVKREKAVLASLQSCEKQKADIQEELAAEKRKATLLHQKLQRAKDARDKAEGKLHQEEEASRKLVNTVHAVKKEREQIEASTKSKEDSMKIFAGIRLGLYRDEIIGLERGISQLRLKKDSSKIAALKRGIETTTVRKGSTVPDISKMTDMPSAVGGVRRDRECVMCLMEEMSVVFLPCAHQVVCAACNELHEKKGMKDCPSCRTPIGQRVTVRYSR